MAEDNGRYADLLKATLADIQADIRQVARENLESRRILHAEVNSMRAELAEMKVKLAVIWGLGSALGGACVVAASKLMGIVR